jgi:hypothetical protein
VLSILFPSNQSAEYDGLLKKQLDAATGGKALTDAQKAGLKAAAALAGDLVRNHTGGASAEYPGFKFGAPGPFVYQLAPGQKYALYPQVRWLAGWAESACCGPLTLCWVWLKQFAVPPAMQTTVSAMHCDCPNARMPVSCCDRPKRLVRVSSFPSTPLCLFPQQLGNAKPFVVPQPELSAIVTNTDAAKGPVFKVPPISDYETARKLGANTTDKALGETALFWADGANTSAISGHWLDIAKRVSAVGRAGESPHVGRVLRAEVSFACMDSSAREGQLEERAVESRPRDAN